MKQVGLHPSSTGMVGGKETGQKMSDYIIKGAAFDKACQSLLSTKFALKWGEFIDEVGDVCEDGDIGGTDGNCEGKPKTMNRSNRLKYSCACCGVAVWGKPNLNIICGDCGMPMGGED